MKNLKAKIIAGLVVMIIAGLIYTFGPRDPLAVAIQNLINPLSRGIS